MLSASRSLSEHSDQHPFCHTGCCVILSVRINRRYDGYLSCLVGVLRKTGWHCEIVGMAFTHVPGPQRGFGTAWGQEYQVGFKNPSTPYIQTYNASVACMSSCRFSILIFFLLPQSSLEKKKGSHYENIILILLFRGLVNRKRTGLAIVLCTHHSCPMHLSGQSINKSESTYLRYRRTVPELRTSALPLESLR